MNVLFESFLHAIVDAVLVGIGLRVWGIAKAEPRQRFMSLILILPVSTPILFYGWSTKGSLPGFYRGALFNGERWLHVELLGIPFFRWGFFVLMGACAAAFLFQELLPIYWHFRQSKRMRRLLKDHWEKIIPLQTLGLPPIKELEGLRIQVLPDHWGGISSLYGGSPRILIGEGLLEELDREELRAVVAHEIAHLGIGRRPFMLLMYVFRAIAFLNPVALGAFRFIANEEECVCDDRAVWLTSVSPLSLASALKKLYQPDQEPELADCSKQEVPGLFRNLSAVGLREQLDKRIERLRSRTYSSDDPGYWSELFIVTLGCLALSFAVVG